MSRDLTKEEQQKFADMYGTGTKCVSCGNADVTVMIWEKYSGPTRLRSVVISARVELSERWLPVTPAITQRRWRVQLC